MPNLSVLLQELEIRWRAMFTRLQAGGEIAPSLRLRSEGLMEAAVLLQAATPRQLQTSMARIYQECFGQALVADWEEIFPFPQIPGFGQRAPVYPSTRE